MLKINILALRKRNIDVCLWLWRTPRTLFWTVQSIYWYRSSSVTQESCHQCGLGVHRRTALVEKRWSHAIEAVVLKRKDRWFRVRMRKILPPGKESQDLVPKQERASRVLSDRLVQQLQRCQTINFHGCHTPGRSHFDSSLKLYEVCVFVDSLQVLQTVVNMRANGCLSLGVGSAVNWLTCSWYAVQTASVIPTLKGAAG